MIEFWALVFTVAAIYTLVAVGTQLQFGYAGLLNFGQAGFALVAAYTMAILVVRTGIHLWVGAAIGVIAATILGAMIAIPVARLRQVFLGIATVGLSEILRYLAMNLSDLTGGPLGTSNLLGPSTVANYNQDWLALQKTIQDWLAPIPGVASSPDVAPMILFWIIAGASVLLMSLLCRTPWGRLLRAIREDEGAASAMGKNTLLLKVQAFAIGSACAGLAGIMLACWLSAVTPDDFDPNIALAAYLIVFLAGMSRMAALPIGALIFGVIYSGTRFFNGWPFDLMGQYEQGYVRYILIGLLLIAVMLFRPQGIFGRRAELVL